jgi:hypothetical protein
LSANRSLDGVADVLNSRAMTDAGPIDLVNDRDSDEEDLDLLPPGGVSGAADEMWSIRQAAQPGCRRR